MSGEETYYTEEDHVQDKRKRMSCALDIQCPINIQKSLLAASQDGFHFIVTEMVHPDYTRNLLDKEQCRIISRTDRVLSGMDWNRLIVGKITPKIDVDSEIEEYRNSSKALLNQELSFANHLGLPAIMLTLHRKHNPMLAHFLYNRFVLGCNAQYWITLPLVHPSKYSPLCNNDEVEDIWEWWNDLRTLCHFDKHLCLALELPETRNLPPMSQVERWLGEPVKALIIRTSLFLTNQHKKPVLARAHQEVIQKFMTIDVQYIIRGPTYHESNYIQYNAYFHYLGKKLYKNDTMSDFTKGCEDFLQNPLQPLSEHLEAMIYDVFEKDQVKYLEYQSAIQKAISDLPEEIVPVIMVVGAGRGPLVQAALNASYLEQRRIKLYAVEKNPYAINTLQHRVQNEWKGQVTLVHQDMRTYEPPEKADILVSELLGSFGDNELSPECLDGAQRFLKKGGISIPRSYTSYLAPIMSSKIHNEIRNNRPADKTLQTLYETPYVIHLVNFYQIAESQPLFTFEHPNFADVIDNTRYKVLSFKAPQKCVLTGFAGFFDTVLYKNVMLSINPQTRSKDMVSWFPICFPLSQPISVNAGETIEVSFWRAENSEKVWYEWCVNSPLQTAINNPNGRSYFIKKH